MQPGIKNAILITGSPAAGKNILAFTIASEISHDKRTWLFCSKASDLSLGHDTKVVIVDGIRKIEAIEPFFELLDKGAFFIFISTRITRLPDGEKWTKHLAHFQLTSFYDFTLFFDHENGSLPANIMETIKLEMGKRQAGR